MPGRDLFAEGGGRDLFAQPVHQASMLGPLQEMFSGESKQTEQTRNLPELHQSGLLHGEDKAKALAVSPALMTTTDPNEIAQIVTSNFPNVGVTYNKDAEGGVYPVLVNNETGAATIINRPGMSGFDVLQTLGIGAALFPANRAASAMGAATKSAMGEAALQGVQAASGGEFNPEEVALSAGIGGAGQGVENALSAVTRGARGQATGNAVVDAAENLEVPIMTSDVAPPETFVGKQLQQAGESIPLAGTGGKRAAQQQAREKAVNDTISKYGDFNYDNVVSSLRDNTSRLKRAAGNVLQSTGEALDQAGQVDLAATRKAAQEAHQILNKPGVIQSGNAIKDLKTLVDALDQPQAFTSLKENRTAFREILQGVDKAERSQLPSRAKAALTAVGEAMGRDMERFARNNLTPEKFAKWQKANNAYAAHANSMKRTKLKSLLDSGDVRPEQVETMLFSTKPSEVKLLYDSLTAEGRKNARGAIISKVVTNLSRRQNGVTPNSFATELKKYDVHTDIFFKGEELRKLRGLQRVLEATTRAQDSAANPPTGRQLITLLTGGAIGLDVAATGGLPISSTAVLGGTGLLARAYESQSVRGALLRLGSIPPDSDAFDRALRDATSALTGAAQATAEAEESPTEPAAR